jgi:hypothetical protein
MKKFKLKSTKKYKYSYDLDLMRITKDFKKSLVSKETFLEFLNRTFANINIELFNIRDKVFYLLCTGNSSGYRYIKLELSLFGIISCGNFSYRLPNTVYKRAKKLLYSCVSLG